MLNFHYVIGLILLLSLKPAMAQNTGSTSADWVTAQLKAKDVKLISIIDEKAWSHSPVPNTRIILGIGERVFKLYNDNSTLIFVFVILVQSSSPNELKDPKLLALSVPENTPEGYFLLMPAALEKEEEPPPSIDLCPFPLKKNEYAFGVRFRVGSVGNKGGCAFEVLGLFRYYDSTLKEIFRDIVWAYSLYEKGDQSCNSEMVIVPERKGPVGFYSYVRKHKRSYYGETKYENYKYKDLKETPVKSCSSFKQLEKPNTHTWNEKKGIYLDSRDRLLWWDDLFK